MIEPIQTARNIARTRRAAVWRFFARMSGVAIIVAAWLLLFVVGIAFWWCVAFIVTTATIPTAFLTIARRAEQ